MNRILKIVCACLALMMVFTSIMSTQTALFDAHAATIKISKTKVTLTKGKSTTLKITGTKSKVSWSSSKTSVATVSKTGKITAKKAGTATITANVSKKKLTCKVTVKNPPKYTTYKAGMYKAGTSIPAGQYCLFKSGKMEGYYEICKNSTGSIDAIIDNDIFSYNQIVTLSKGQYLKLNYCYAIPIAYAKISTAGAGVFRVGTDIKAGEYKIKSSGISGYYEIKSDNSPGFSSIIDNDNFDGTRYITVENGQYLKLSYCKIIN